MKKTRILAALLCLMMVVCILPVMQASAAADIPFDAIGTVLGGNYSIIHPGSSSWGPMELDFTDNFDPSAVTGLTAGEVVSFSNENGATFTGSGAMYYSSPTKYSNYWSPLNNGSWGFRFKMNSNGWLITSAVTDWSTGLSEITFAPTYITITNAKESTKVNDYTCGTDWNDVLIVKDNATANDGIYSLWMKKDTDTAYTKVYTVTADAYTNNGYWTTYGARFDAQNVSIQYSSCFYAQNYYDSVEEIMDAPVATTYNFEMDEKFASTMTPDNTMGITHNGTYTENGWTGTSWKLLGASGVNWSPLKSGGFESAIAFTASVSSTGMNVQGHSPLANGRIYFDIDSASTIYSNAPTKTYQNQVIPDSNPADYLITQADNGTGYALYMKSETVTGGKWALMIETSDYNSSNSSNRGFVFSITNGDCPITNVRMYSKNAVDDAATKPAGATELLYEENFDETPGYANIGGTGISYDNGNMVMTRGDAKSEVWWFNTEIPVGGYAEYRMANGDSDTSTYFRDSATHMCIYQRAGYGTVTGASSLLYAFDGGEDTYRTWRVVRNSANSYSVYCKADDDTAWYNAATNATAETRSDSKHIYFTGNAAYDGGEGVAKFDYMKVYGPAITEPLTLTDGYNTVSPNEGSKLVFPTSLRAIVKAETGKLLVVNYADNDMLSAQIVDVASMTDDSVILNAKVSGGNKVKVFFWDSFTSLNSLKNVATFTY